MADLTLADARVEVPELYEPLGDPYSRVQINHEHKLAQGLLGFWLLTNPKYAINLVDGVVTPATDTGGLLSAGHDKFGRFVRFDNPVNGDTSATSGFNVGTTGDKFDALTNLTIVTGIKMRTNPGGDGWGRILSNPSGTSDQYALRVRAGDGPSNDRAFYCRIDGDDTPATPQFPAETYLFVAARYDSLGGAGAKNVWVNRQVEASETADEGATNSGNGLEIGHHSATERGFTGDIYFAGIYDRYLSDNELLELERHPRQFLVPE